MKRITKLIALATSAFMLSLAGNSPLFHFRAKAQEALPGSLATAQWLHDHLDQVTVIDIRDNMQRITAAPRFNIDGSGKKTLVETGGHIPGAILVDFAKIRAARVVNGVSLNAMMPTKEAFQATMDAAGLDKQRPIVIAAVGDAVNSLDMATRLFFQLKYFGENNVAVLNGGTNSWLSAGYQVSTDPIGVRHGDWAATAERRDILATTDDVKAAMRTHSVQLVDARPTAQFFGIIKKSGSHCRGTPSRSPLVPDRGDDAAGRRRTGVPEREAISNNSETTADQSRWGVHLLLQYRAPRLRALVCDA